MKFSDFRQDIKHLFE